jgi:hypothetical protein
VEGDIHGVLDRIAAIVRDMAIQKIVVDSPVT